jgi:hypothetical protein
VEAFVGVAPEFVRGAGAGAGGAGPSPLCGGGVPGGRRG